MARLHQLVFTGSLVGLCWLGMMAVHELGHVIGASATGGTVQRLVLHPLSISRTDVFPNPHPAVVVWLGPLVGCLLPLVGLTAVPRATDTRQRRHSWHPPLQFFAGFCLIANGAYIALGSFDRVGDCGEMLRTGTPLWVMLAFGLTTVPAGLVLWHRLGSIRKYVRCQDAITPAAAYGLLGVLIVVVLAAGQFSGG